MIPHSPAPRPVRRLPAVLVGLLVVGLLLGASGARADDPAPVGAPPVAGWLWPVSPVLAVEHPYDEPAGPYAPGHRGVDLRSEPGAPVTAVAAGRVTFAGHVAGVGVVTVEHAGGTRSTYQPVDTSGSVVVGTSVEAGGPLGTLGRAGSHCAPDACLHLGRIEGEAYADPLELLGGTTGSSGVVLVDPVGPPPVAPDRPTAPSGDGRLLPPLIAPVTSPFGMRLHPVTGVWKLHDGTDFGASCGTPVHAAGDGVVTASYYDSAYGNRVIVDHGVVGEGALSTSYNHLTAASVTVGAPVRAGDVLGTVGTTGLSTGCHLHFMVTVGGSPTDPMGWI